MKYISKKDFRATRKTEYTNDVERRLGLMTGDVSGDYVYTYVDGSIYISVERGSEYKYQVLVGRGSKTFKTLKKAEKCLYKYLKESEMEKYFSQDEIIEVVHEIASIIAACSSKWVSCRKVLQGNESMDKFIDENPTYDRIELVTEMAREFLTDWHNLTQTEKEERDFLEQIDYFCEMKFPTENKKMQIENPIGYEEYLTIEFINNLRERNSEEYEKLNGFCGATTKANELVAKFKKEYKGASWGENGFDSMPNELECFLEREFGMAEKKEFQVIQKVLITKYVNVEAYTEGEAGDIGIDMIENKEYLEDNIDVQSFEVNELK